MKARFVMMFCIPLASATPVCLSACKSYTKHFFKDKAKKTEDLKGLQTTSTTATPKLKLMIGDLMSESQIFTLQSAEAETKVLGWNGFHRTL